MGMTQNEFQEEFGDIMLHGLDSISTYIPLRTNKAQGINVAIRPKVVRVSQGVVLFGGTFRVGYTMDENHEILKKSVTSISEDAAAARLQDFCKGFTWRKADNQRFSTIVGFGVAATRYDGEAILAALEEGQLAKDFITRLESKYKQYNDVGFTSNRRVAIQALNAAWTLQSNSVFAVLPKAEQLPGSVVGMHSGVLNQAQDSYNGNVLSFQDKVDALADAVDDDVAAEAAVDVEAEAEATTDSD